MDMGRLGELLRELEPLQEKTVRLRYGLGCQRPAHRIEEIAGAFGISSAEVARTLDTARHRLMRLGLDAGQLRAAVSVPLE